MCDTVCVCVCVCVLVFFQLVCPSARLSVSLSLCLPLFHRTLCPLPSLRSCLPKYTHTHTHTHTCVPASLAASKRRARSQRESKAGTTQQTKHREQSTAHHTTPPHTHTCGGIARHTQCHSRTHVLIDRSIVDPYIHTQIDRDTQTDRDGQSRIHSLI